MAKLTENQIACLAGLNETLEKTGADHADVTTWKKYTAPGIKISVQALLDGGVISERLVAVSGRAVKVYRTKV